MLFLTLGFLCQYLGWQSIFYLQAILSMYQLNIHVNVSDDGRAWSQGFDIFSFRRPTSHYDNCTSSRDVKKSQT